MKKVILSIGGFVCLAGLTAARTGNPMPSPLAWVQAPRFDASAWLAGGERFPSGASVRISDAAGRRALLPNFAASADPAVSSDGLRLLVAAKQHGGDPWQVFEVVLADGAPRQITTGAGDCVRPFYLPEDRIVYTRISREGSWIEAAPLAGGIAQRLSFSGTAVLTDGVLRDGRILFETQFRSESAPVREIMTIYPDGTGVEAVRCDHRTDRHSAREASNGDIIFVDAGKLARFTPALAHQTTITQPSGEFAGSITESAAGDWIAPVRQNAQGRYRLVRWHAGARIGTLVEAAANADAVEPVALAPHEEAKRFPSALVASRTAVNLLCLDAHTSRERMDGSIAALRVFTHSADGREQLLGQTAVEQDGSFFVQTPGDRPIRMELLDSTGRILRAEKNWWWGRTAEQRVCVGCHAGPERAPENAVPAVLLRHDVPVKMLTPEDGGR